MSWFKESGALQDSVGGVRSNIDVASVVRDKIVSAGLWRGDRGECDECRSHLISPDPFPLNAEQVDTLKSLGNALLAFYTAVNTLYLRPGNEWVKEYLDIGKPQDLLRQARMNYQKQALPRVIRPDLLITDDGFVITELDSVPGGIGHLDCLSVGYEEAGYKLIGSPRGMRNGFAAMIRDASGKDDPVCAIVVSDESVDYLPEMTYLAGELRNTGLRAYTLRPKEVIFTEDGLILEADGEKLRVDVVYRFFELFDLLNIPKAELVAYAARHKLVVLTPPYKPFLEEKMLLAFLHSEFLKEYWTISLGKDYYELLKGIISPTWIMDNRPVPPHAEIAGFRLGDRPLRDWQEIRYGSQKERELILKPSGFSPLAWGARGVKVGQDMSQEDWANAVEDALDSFNRTPYVLQPFYNTKLHDVKYYDPSANHMQEMKVRVRLCAYYFITEGNAGLAGVLATSCPKDKKLIHGMTDAVMSPCYVPGE